MNQVHEQCPKIDLGTVLSQTKSKTGRVRQVHSLQPSSTPRCAQARPSVRTPGRIVGNLAVSWPRPPAILQPKLLCRSAHVRAPARRALRPCSPCPAPLLAVPCVLQASMAVSQRTGYRIVGVYCARTWPCRGLGRNTALSSALLLVTIHHGVLRYSVCLAYPLPVTIQFGLYRDMLIPQPAYLFVTIQPVYCDTLFPSHQALAVTIQKLYRDTAYQPTNLQYSSPMLQYNPNLLQYTFLA